MKGPQGVRSLLVGRQMTINLLRWKFQRLKDKAHIITDVELSNQVKSNKKTLEMFNQLERAVNFSAVDICIGSNDFVVYEDEGRLRFKKVEGTLERYVYQRIRTGLITIGQEIKKIRKPSKKTDELHKESLVQVDREVAQSIRKLTKNLEPDIKKAKKLSNIAGDYEKLLPGMNLSASKKALEDLRALLDD